jgi:hypothetical protein
MTTQDRQPAGVPAGGQFAAAAHPENGTTLLAAVPTLSERAASAWRDAQQGSADDEALATVANAMSTDKVFRDAVLIDLIDGSLTAGGTPEELAAAEHAHAPLAKVFQPGGQPPGAAADRGERTLRHVLSSVDGKDRSGPLGVVSFLSWWRGEDGAAAAYAEEAVKIDSENTLGILINQALETGMHPRWMYRNSGSDADQ